jgi:hypothetical protein
MGEPHATWIGLGSNRDGHVRRLLAAKTGAPEPATLAARPGLEPIRNGKALSSGFVTLATLTHPIDALMLSPAAALRGSSLSAMRGMLENLPHKGETPMFVSSTVAASGPGARAEVTTNVPRGSLEDMGAILLALHRLAGSAGLLPP